MFALPEIFLHANRFIKQVTGICLLIAVSMTTNAATIVGNAELLNQTDADQIETWLGSGPVQFTMIYQKAAGDTSYTFHNAVDNKGPTVTLLQAQPHLPTPIIIGGYNPLSWTSVVSTYNLSQNDRNAFVFNLSANPKTKLSQRADVPGIYQTYNSANSGPTFGGGHDIYVPFNLSAGIPGDRGYSNLWSYADTFIGYGEGVNLATVIPGGDLQYGKIEVFSVLPPLVDSDNDGVPDSTDNCPINANTDQANADSDVSGDACDVCPLDSANDSDGDGVCGNIDNCPTNSNTAQINSDGDTVGDACDNDDDNDGVTDIADNCPLNVNPDQADQDHDGAGNVCDTDDDNDLVLDVADQCQNTPEGAVTNINGCAIADLCACNNNWKNHGAYVSCVARAANAFVEDELITATEKDAMVSTAAQSTCGKKK